MEDLKQQIVAMRQSFFDEEILDNHFIQLEQLGSEENPNFAKEVVTVFLNDSMNNLAIIEDEMKKSPVDHLTVDRYLHQLKGSSASIGANKIKIAVNKARDACREGDIEGSRASLQVLRREVESFKAKLETYYQLVAQVHP
ncbi:pseudo histidine-containing phosphotransfer protein 5-like [Mangifera indica]|uniref:pseudo histidine-containing phosphotransfer protein 5-like n=1 Tax=Mangifera indica TaxID=29780 RepID=UPI001CFAEBD6|nr:pseudo histidine-containing phosphotransfer protein 5-like [Mangifera indica]